MSEFREIDYPTALRYVAFANGLRGQMKPGSFYDKLMETIRVADGIHRAQLFLIFPNCVMAWTYWQTNGPEALTRAIGEADKIFYGVEQ